MPVELLPPHQANPDNPAWHEMRRDGVTASEIPVILGISRWDSPWSMWHRKRGLIPDQVDNDDMAWGRRLEGAIADAAAERLDPHQNLVFARAGLYRHDRRAWQMATPDRLTYTACPGCAAVDDAPAYVGAMVRSGCDCDPPGTSGPAHALLEVKHPYSWDGWGDDGTDDIPADYMAQGLWQLDVMDLDECWLAAYTRHQMRIYTIRRDAEGADVDLAMMRQRALEFLASADPPPLDSHPATLAAVKALHPDLEDREQGVPNQTARIYLGAQERLRDAKAGARQAEAELRAVLGSGRYAVNYEGDRIATRSVYERRNLDAAGLRADHPDLAVKYTTTTTVDRLTPARKDTDDQGE